MKTIGLTGGIASGKSAVATIFAEQHHINVVDSDVIAREVVLPHTPAWQAIIDHFGESILQSDKTIDRSQLRNIIFKSADERRWLEQLLHPAIRQEMAVQLNKKQSPYSIAVIPLLVENLPHPLVDRVLVVDVPESLQLERLIARDKNNIEQATAMIASQATRKSRLAVADDVIDNSQDLQVLQQQVNQLHQQYLQWVKPYGK